MIPAMENGLSRDENRRMRELAAKGSLNEEREVDVAAMSLDDVELVHLSDVMEMQSLLTRAADELERLYGRAQPSG